MKAMVALMMVAIGGLAFHAALGLRPGRRLVVLVLLAVPILVAPAIVPPVHGLVRSLLAIAALAVVLKMFDVHIGALRPPSARTRPGLLAYAAFLPNIFGLVYRKLQDEPRGTARENLALLARSVAGMAAGLALMVGLYSVDWRARPFWLEHCAKVVGLYAVLMPASGAGAALWRWLIGPARGFMDAPYAATTPADFWRRYNRPVNQFFYEDLFKPIGGLRSPIRAALLAFVASAAVHEYVFSMGIGQVQGYQTAFFLVQGVAVAATARVRSAGWRAWPGVAATLVFNLATSMLFFASVNELLPFYSRSW